MSNRGRDQIRQRLKEDLVKPPVEHELKTWPEFYEEVEQNRKLFEIRRDDRNFKVGDVLWLREYTLGVGLSGRETRRRITYITDWKQADGYVVLGIEAAIAKAEGR